VNRISYHLGLQYHKVEEPVLVKVMIRIVEILLYLIFQSSYKVTVSIPAFDLFPHPRITPFCIFSLTYSCTWLELFSRGQSMQVHDLAKNEWILFTARKWMQSTYGNSGL
jgi:hypothetical protein